MRGESLAPAGVAVGDMTTRDVATAAVGSVTAILLSQH
jgi:hypothetical protein